ncbi:hypothetical protein BHM03_00049787, partial [Ensete ventricosum]
MPLNQEQGRKKEKALVDSAHTLLVYELEPCAPCMTWIPSIGFRGQIGSSGICLGRVGSRRDPSDGQVSLAIDFAISLLRRGAGAFIVRVTGSPYLSPLSSFLLTIPLHLTMPSVVLAARRVPVGKGCRPCPPYLSQVGCITADPSMPASGRLPRVGSATLAGQSSGGAGTWRPVVQGRENVAA